MRRLLEASLPELILKIVTLSAWNLRESVFGTFRSAKAEIGFSFDTANPSAIQYAIQHAAELVTSITRETSEAINTAIVESFRESISVAETARIIRGSIGLTETYAAAVSNLRKRIAESPGNLIYAGSTPIRVPFKGMPAPRMDKLLRQYSDRLIRARAITIARTETIRASNEGQRLLWQQAVQKGILSGQEMRQWIAFDPCDICTGYDGEKRRLSEPFRGGLTGPPAHPNCRCTTGLVRM